MLSPTAVLPISGEPWSRRKMRVLLLWQGARAPPERLP